MKKTFFAFFLIIASFICSTQVLHAQKKFASAGEYMSNIGQEFRKITEAYLFYNSELAHSKKARAVEKSRQELINTVVLAKKRTAGLPAWEGDIAFRDAAGEFFRIYEIVLKEDYEKILDLEDIAEQSYDAMEAYLTVRDMASEKLDEANTVVDKAEEKFAEDFDINLVASEDKLSQKAKQTSEVNRYHRILYLMFFKAYKQEDYLIEAQKTSDVSAMQQNQSSLLKVAQDQLKYLDTVPRFKGNPALIDACRGYITFALKEAKEANYTTIILEKEKFEEAQKKFKSISKPSKEEVNTYNAIVENYNKTVEKSNKDNNFWNNSRAKALNDWNNESQNFISRNIPKYNKK